MSENKSELVQLLDEVVKHWPIGGGVVVIVTPDGDPQFSSFGYSDVASKVPISLGDRFEIGSISKLFVSLLINQLIDENHFSLDSQVSDLLPFVVLPGSASKATVRHLLTHTAGLISGSESVPDALAQSWMLRDTSATVTPGEFFHYSNAGFILLGLIVETFTGKTLANALAERVLVPARMTHSLGAVTHADRSSLAIGQSTLRDDAPWIPGEQLVPATWLEVSTGDGNVASTAGDMARFLRVLLDAGTIDGTVIVSPQSYARVINTLGPDGEETLTCGRHEIVHSSRYGLGVNVEETISGRLLTHGGGMVGYASFLIADLASGIGVVVLTNANGDTPIAEWIARDVHASHSANSLVSSTPRQLDPSVWHGHPDMTGRFSSSSGEIELEFTKGQQLMLTFNGKSGRVFWTLGGRFACEHPDFRLFHLGYERRGDVGVWSYGANAFYSKFVAEAAEETQWNPFTGHYRSHSAWFTNFRIFQREGKLMLSAASGVEAPQEEVELIPLPDGTFRCGVDPRLPERVSFGPVVNRRAIWAEKDGSRYSRTFTQ